MEDHRCPKCGSPAICPVDCKGPEQPHICPWCNARIAEQQRRFGALLCLPVAHKTQ
jgi:hypothetical protein